MRIAWKICSDKTVSAKIVKMLTTKNRQMKKKIKQSPKARQRNRKIAAKKGVTHCKITKHENELGRCPVNKSVKISGKYC